MSSEAPPRIAETREAVAAAPRPRRRDLAPPPAGRVLACVFVAVMAALPLVIGANWVNTLTRAWISSLAVFSITLLTGVAGLLSFGQAGFVGLGAYTYGVLAVAGVSPELAVGAAILMAASVGFLLALPAARLKGSYLAIGTLGFGVLVAQLLNNMVGVTRGPMGLLAIPSFGRDRTAWYFAAMTTSLLTMAGLRLLERRSYLGVIFKSIKHDDIASSACGIAVFRIKLLAFSLSAVLAGLSGALYAAHARYLTPDLFVTGESFQYLMIAVVGGIGHASGGMIASLLLTVLPEGLRALGETNLRLLVYGTMVLFVLWFLPEGIGSVIERCLKPGRRTADPRDVREPAAALPDAPDFPGRAPEAAGRSVAVPAGPRPGVPTVQRAAPAAVPMLEIRGLSKHFGWVHALDSVTLTGLAGEVHGLVGPNGAGKSTLIGCITGLLGIDGGEVVFRGRRIDRSPSHLRARQGIARTFQKIRLAQPLTVFENVAIGCASGRAGTALDVRRMLAPLWSGAIAERVDDALRTAGISDLRHETVSSLPYGKRHLVEIARCLVAVPRLLLLDEPATGLADGERLHLQRLVRRLAESGCLVVLVEHDLKLVGQLCDRVSVLESGRRIFTGTPAAAQRDAAVVKAYLGSSTFADGP